MINKKSFTLIELMIGITIMGSLITSSFYVYISMKKVQLRMQIENEFYTESRLFMEKFAKEIRTGYVDYEEYYNQKNSGSCAIDCSNVDATDTWKSGKTFFDGNTFGNYGECYGYYATRFYLNENHKDGICSNDIKAKGKEENGEDAFDDTNPITDKLFLINMEGSERRYFIFSAGINDDGKVKKLILSCKEYTDGTSEYNYDFDGFGTKICKTWGPHVDFADFTYTGEDSFVDITPNILNVVSFTAEVFPKQDPYLYKLANKEKKEDVRYHPYVRLTIKTESAVFKKHFSGEEPPTISLSTTVSLRSYSNIRSFL